MPTTKNTLAQAQCTLCFARVWKSAIVAHNRGLAILPIAWSCSLCRSLMVAGMSSGRSNILTPATRSVAADIPRLRNASSPNRHSISGRSVAQPHMAPRASCMCVLDELASTPLMAMPVPTVPHSSVLACMTLTPWDVALGSPLSSFHCWWSGFIAFVWSMPWIMRSIASFVPSVPAGPIGSPACVLAVDASSSDTRP